MTLSSDGEQQGDFLILNRSKYHINSYYITSHALTILEAQQIAAPGAPSASMHWPSLFCSGLRRENSHCKFLRES